MNTSTSAAQLRAIGMTDEQTVCDLCGRNDLRGTVIVADSEGNETGRYGTSCVQHVTGVRVSRSDAQRMETARRERVVLALRRAKAAAADGQWRLAALDLRDARLIGMVRDDERERYASIQATIAASA